MFLRCAFVAILLCICAISAFSQSSIVIDNDPRVFTTVAALNVAGFDVDLAPQYHPARTEIRKIAETLDPDLLRRLRDFYTNHKGGRSDDEQLPKYISLAVVLTDPPELKPVSREETLSDSAREVLGFADLLREFYQKASITRRWADLQDQYEAEMDRITDPIRNAIVLTDAYLRVPLGGPASQTMRITVELAAPQNSVNVRSHQDDYFVVLGPSQTVRTEEIRHAYLHVRLNNAVVSNLGRIEKRDSLLKLAAAEEGVQREYTTDFHVMMSESLIRAIELRMDRVGAARAQETVRGYYRTGLLLAPFFYESLLRYEATDASLDDALREMAAAIDIGKETERFAQTFRSIPVPERQQYRAEAPAAPREDPVGDLLRSAQAAFDSDKPRAKEAFEKVLNTYDANNGRALYGMGLIALDAREFEDAKKYFDLTLKSTTPDFSMKTWAHIHLGHILDFECERTGAVDNYQRAIQLGDNTSNAQNVAQQGLKQPYGGGCQ